MIIYPQEHSRLVCRLHRDDVEQHHDEQEGGELCIGSTDGNTSSVSSFYKASTVRLQTRITLKESSSSPS
ncbi:unnamed protein product [Musa banksii]